MTSLSNCVDIQRSTPRGDLNCQKFFGIATGTIGFFSTLYSIGTYLGSCRDNLPTENIAGEDIEYGLGPALLCLIVATFLKVIDVIIHILVPVPLRNEDKDNVDLDVDEAKIGAPVASKRGGAGSITS
mmetsp:Transcript_15653/g.21958  ORF Transcript_15653/g.21958 Transcript_15653/m.21958 type:complete len:128 (+) Transcript_15653:574-957(+)